MDWLQIVVTAILSPLILKTYEVVLNKSGEKERANEKRFAVLDARIQDLQDVNIKQLIQIGNQQTKIDTQEKEIHTLQLQVKERDERISELQLTVDILSKKRK